MRQHITGIVLLGLLAPPIAAKKAVPPKPLTALQVKAVALAIEDEVYDRGLQKRFYMVRKEVSPGVTRLPMYVKPTVSHGGSTVIYILMPYGEVVRGFHFTKRGLAVLEGDPDGGFPPTDSDTLTLYMSDGDVCRWKQTWRRSHFDIIDSPTPEQVQMAADRQKQRVGYSYRELPPKEQRTTPPGLGFQPEK